MKKITCLITVLLLVLSMSACGSSKNTSSSTYAVTAPSAAPAMKEEASVEMYAGSTNSYDSVAAKEPSITEQKMIYTGNISLETTEFDEAVKAIADLTAQMGGYIEDSTVGERGTNYSWANYTIRIPAEKFDAFLNQAGTMYHETYRSTGCMNITEAYYDTQGRLESQKIKLTRLQELLKEAQDMADIITIESAISETEYYIESLSGTLRHYDTQVSYATISVDLHQVYRYSNTEEAPTSFGTRFVQALSRGWNNFTSGMEDFAIFLAMSWMWIILFVVILAFMIFAVQKLRRRRKNKKLAKIKESTDTAVLTQEKTE